MMAAGQDSPARLRPVERLSIDISIGEGGPTNERMFAHIDSDDEKMPRYTTKEVAKFFFQRSPAWMRWRYSTGFLHDAQAAGISPQRNEHNVKEYTLADIEEMAHLLHEKGHLSTQRLLYTLVLLRYTALGYELVV